MGQRAQTRALTHTIRLVPLTDRKVGVVSARDEVLAAAKVLAAKSIDGTFTANEVINELRTRGTDYQESTIRTHVASRMCANAPDNHVVTYKDFVRVDRNRYRLYLGGA